MEPDSKSKASIFVQIRGTEFSERWYKYQNESSRRESGEGSFGHFVSGNDLTVCFLQGQDVCQRARGRYIHQMSQSYSCLNS